MHPSTRVLGVATLMTLASAILPTPASADVPDASGYQGLVLDADGQPLDDTVEIAARIYDDPVSASPADLLYEEVHRGVAVVDGVFQITLGQGSSPTGTFDASTFASPDTWLEVEVDGEILTPRQKLQTVAYSFRAQECVDATNAALLGGQTAADIVAGARTGLAFADIGGEAADAQIPASITRDAEVFQLVLFSDGSGSQLDADLLDGLSADEIVTFAQTGLTFATIGGALSDGQIPANVARDSEIVPTVLSQDGPGSGLNADLLDGLEGSAFVQQGGVADLSSLRVFDGANSTALIDGGSGSMALGGSGRPGNLLVADDDGLFVISIRASAQGPPIALIAEGIHLDGATGNVTNKLEGEGLVKGWARINADGTVASCWRCSTDPSDTRQLSTGGYEVDFTFATDIRDRPWTCGVGTSEVLNLVQGTTIFCVQRGLDPSSVFVRTSDASGNATNAPFTIVVY